MLDNSFLVSVGFNKGKSRFHQVKTLFRFEIFILFPLKIPKNALWNWVAQIHGRISVQLVPDMLCNSECPKLKRLVLKPGDLRENSSNNVLLSLLLTDLFHFLRLVIYSSIYEASYAPLSKETILMVQGFE